MLQYTFVAFCEVSVEASNVCAEWREKVHYLSASPRRYHQEHCWLIWKHGMTICWKTVWRWLKHYSIHGSCSPLPQSGCPTRLTHEVLESEDSAMQSDDETTAQELVVKLQGLGFSMSKHTVVTGCGQLGWNHCGSAYWQLIHDVNKQKRLEWVLAYRNNHFHDVIWLTKQLCSWRVITAFVVARDGNLDQSIIQKFTFGLESVGEGHLHLWWMNVEMYVDILKEWLIPFCLRIYPSGHRFMQDNDPKHTSHRAHKFFEDNNINWWRMPPGSPDAKPIENLSHELKVN